MKRLYLLSILLYSYISAFPQAGDSLLYISLKPDQFREETGIVSFPLIIDVREFFEFRRSRLEGAINIPASGNIDMYADTIDKTRHLFFYCASDFRSKRVAQKFSEKGFIHVYNLDGGIKGWKKAGLRIDRRRQRNRS